VPGLDDVRVVVFQRCGVCCARVCGRGGALEDVEDYGRWACAGYVDFLVRGDVAEGAGVVVVSGGEVEWRREGLWGFGCCAWGDGCGRAKGLPDVCECGGEGDCYGAAVEVDFVVGLGHERCVCEGSDILLIMNA